MIITPLYSFLSLLKFNFLSFRVFIVMPPMYRTTPLWYLDGLNDILLKFSSVMNIDRPKNLLLASSFPSSVLEVDGVHLTPYSGYEFILHLFDEAARLIKGLSKTPETFVLENTESIRALEDRVVVLEQDHRRLSKANETKVAVDSEIDDFLENQRHEDSFIVSGLKRVSSGLTTKEWQDQAQQDVRLMIGLLLNREPPILVVHNQTGVRKVTTYLVQMANVKDACEIRSKFGSFFAGGKDRRPTALKDVSIGNWVTPATKVRIAILKVLAERYRASNPGGRVQVIGYQSRPSIRIMPPSGSKDRRIKNFNFIQAIRSLPTSFTPDQINSIMAKVNPNLYGSLRSVFVVLDDDMPKVHKARGAERSDPASSAPSSASRPNSPGPSSPRSTGSPAVESHVPPVRHAAKRAATPPRTKSSKSSKK